MVRRLFYFSFSRLNRNKSIILFKGELKKWKVSPAAPLWRITYHPPNDEQWRKLYVGEGTKMIAVGGINGNELQWNLWFFQSEKKKKITIWQ